ncbi:hypothetical protein SDC9_206590 [bioreactor metagenome]|uniref:Leucine-binding protein domain-containing protein n=1 Tax=bioreactor metagenome TaxID=1076179 RepID=A0A645JEN8_9ZZZZ
MFNDDFAGGYQAGQYLLRQGCRNLVFLSITTGDQVYNERWNGFSAAAVEGGGNARRLMMPWPLPVASHQQLQERYTRLFRSARVKFADADGFGCCNDTCAEIVFKIMRKNASTLPLIGYDGWTDAGLPAQWSTITIDYVAIGRYGVRKLNNSLLPRFLRILPECKIQTV